jgi:hypothetical protein
MPAMTTPRAAGERGERLDRLDDAGEAGGRSRGTWTVPSSSPRSHASATVRRR